MPPKKRSATTRSAAARQQSTLTFNGKQSKVTKPSSPRSTKSAKKEKAIEEDAAKTDIIVQDGPDLADPTTAQAAIDDQAHNEAETLQSTADPLKSSATGTRTADVLGGRAEASDVGAVGGTTGSGWVGDEQATARKITEAQIKRYWREKEQQRLAPRVHQEDLSVHEKILREWDMSNQYGPCIGIARLKRWKRANMLGLEPPLVVLSVLLKEMADGDTKSQRAHVDELMSSRFVET